MDDASRVGRVERIRQLRQDAGDLTDKHLIVREAGRQGFALVVRHRDERLAGMLTDLVHRRDVGMIQGAGGARLPQQASRSVWIIDGSRQQKLERDPPFKMRIFG